MYIVLYCLVFWGNVHASDCGSAHCNGAWSNGISAKTACWVLFFGIIEEFVVRDILLVDSYYVDILSQSL